jgi:hypothetical protein
VQSRFDAGKPLVDLLLVAEDIGERRRDNVEPFIVARVHPCAL